MKQSTVLKTRMLLWQAWQHQKMATTLARMHDVICHVHHDFAKSLLSLIVLDETFHLLSKSVHTCTRWL